MIFLDLLRQEVHTFMIFDQVQVKWIVCFVRLSGIKLALQKVNIPNINDFFWLALVLVLHVWQYLRIRRERPILYSGSKLRRCHDECYRLGHCLNLVRPEWSASQLNDDKRFFGFLHGGKTCRFRFSQTFRNKISCSLGTCRVSICRRFFDVTCLSSVVSSATVAWKACTVGKEECPSASIYLNSGYAICNSRHDCSYWRNKSRIYHVRRTTQPRPSL